MKLLLPVLAVSVAAFAIAAEKSPKAADLPQVKGQYSSPATFQIGGEQPQAGTFSTSARTSKSGRKLKVRITGVADPSDTPVPVDVTLGFTSKGKVTSSSFMMGLYGPLNTDSARFKQKRRTLTFTLKSGPGGASIFGTPLEGSVVYRCKFGRKALSIVGNGTLRVLPAGTPFPYTVNLTGTLVK
jgi:hypothetical protein